jgi:cobalamin biosynthetic protein CobC
MVQSAPHSTRDADNPAHGGDLAWATRRYGAPPAGWLDLSTGVYPSPYPAPDLPPFAMSRFPDRDDMDALIAAARAAYGVPSGVAIQAVPGSEMAIRLLPLIAPQGSVAVVSPTYASHAEAWRAAGRVVIAAGSIENLPADATIAVVGNPNNPDGRMTEPDRLADIARRLGERGGLLVIDEAFADAAPGASLMPGLHNLPAVVLRSLGKFYGLPGLRLGFVAGDAATLARLAPLLGDWPVSGPAVAIGAAVLSDDGWRAATRERLPRDVDRLHEIVDRHLLDVVGGTDFFLLVEDADAGAIHRRLAERGIWTRTFPYEPRWLRLGLPPEDGFTRLDAALAEVR